MALAFAVGAAWFAVSTVLVAGPLSDSVAVTVCVLVVDVLAVLAIAHYWDIPYAVTVGVASVVALDWYYLPPTHAATVPDARNSLALAAYLLMAALLGELAVRARRNAIRSEVARSELAGEQAALRRVATLVARETTPEDVFASVTEEVGKLLEIDIATMLRFETDGTATVVAAWSDSRRVHSGRHASEPRGRERGRRGPRNRPAGEDRQLHASPGRSRGQSARAGRALERRKPHQCRGARLGCHGDVVDVGRTRRG